MAVEAKTWISDGAAVCNVGDISMVVWRDGATKPRIDWGFGLLRSHIAEHRSSGVLVCQFVLSTSTPPDRETREYNARTFKELSPSIRYMVSCPVGDLLWAGVVRAIMRATFLVTGLSKMHGVVSTETEAFEELQQRKSPKTPAISELSKKCNELYEGLGVSARVR